MAYIEELEKRLLFSADLPGTDLALATHDSPGAVYLDLEQSPGTGIGAEAERRELVIIDARTPDYQQLIAGLPAGDERRFEILVLDAERSGIEQISSALAGQRNLSAVHLVSHGGAGELTLGSDTLDNHRVLLHAEAVAGWGDSLTRDADLLIYGCDLASTDEGQDFVLTLSQLTGADVAASDDPTGHDSLGGDWELEYVVGDIEEDSAVSTGIQKEWAHTMALETVKDEFNAAGSYAGNDGTQNWTGDWQEIGESNGAGSGGVRVVNNGFTWSGDALKIDLGASNGASREADLSSAASATLSYEYRQSVGNAGQGQLELQVSDNGGSNWTTLTAYNFAAEDPGPVTEIFDITAYTASNTQIRFIVTSVEILNQFFVDNVQIEYTTGAGDSTAPSQVNNTGSTVAEGGTDTITNTELRYDDDMQPASSVIYTITTVPANGWLELTSNPGVSITSFTQDDPDNNKVVYIHDGSENFTDSFTFDVNDGQGNSVTGQNFSIAISPANDAPTFFIGDGAVTTDFGSGEDIGNSVAVQTDGKILVAGRSYNGSNFDFALTRYNSDGSLDTSFNGDGKLTTDFGPGDDHSLKVSVQADGKILAAGYSFNGSNYDFALVRYNSDGSLDTSFSGDGMLTTAIGATADIGYSAALQADGKILVAGYSLSGLDKDFALVRYNTDGTLDTSFSGDGKLTTDFGSNEDIGYSVTLQADGKILVAGQSKNGAFNDFALARYNTDGALDTSFSGDGMLTTAIGASIDVGYNVTVQPDGKILVAGYSYNGADADFALVRYNTDGSLDTSFSGDGKLTTDFGSGADIGYDVIVQPDGKILVSGFNANGANQDFALARYNADGSLDTSFSGDGMLSTAIGTGDDIGLGIALQPDGKILVSGQSDNGVDIDIALVRYNADGTLDLTFDPVNTLDGAPAFTEGGAPVVLDANAQVFDAELSGADDFSGATLTLVRNGGASGEDLFSATGNLAALTESGNLALSGVTIGAVTTNSAGTLVLSFNANATQARVNETLQSIAYANGSDAPPASVRVDWDFNDGNSGAQGTGGALSATGSTTVTISAVNDEPVSAANVASGSEDATSIPIILTGSDVDGTVDFFRLSSLPAKGTLYTDAGLTITATAATDYAATSGQLLLYFVPNNNWNGVTTFDFSVRDDGGLLDATAATVTLTVNPVNDAPVVNATASDTGTEDTDVVYTHAQLLTLIGATDVDDANANLSVAISNVNNGTLVMSGGSGGAGTTFTITPTPNYVGNLTFDYQVIDDESPTPASSAVGTATVVLSAVNDAPVFNSLDNTPTYIEGGAAVQLDANVTVSDIERDALNGGNGDYTASVLNLQRNGSANPEDVFTIPSGGNLAVSAGNIFVGGNLMAGFTSTGGQLSLIFANSGTVPTTALVNEVLQAITYSNSNISNPPASVQIDYSLNDANSGAQGSGGSGVANGSVNRTTG